MNREIDYIFIKNKTPENGVLFFPFIFLRKLFSFTQMAPDTIKIKASRPLRFSIWW